MISSVPNSVWQPASLAPHCSAAELRVQGQAQGLMGKKDGEGEGGRGRGGGGGIGGWVSQRGVSLSFPYP